MNRTAADRLLAYALADLTGAHKPGGLASDFARPRPGAGSRSLS